MYPYLKRILDFIFAIFFFALLSPIFILVSLLLLITNRGSVFFLQKRPGKHGRIFTILKYRTMKDARDSHGKQLPDSTRLTTVGKFIRSTSLDELPQLLNVIKGDMSIVGPRPLLPEYLPLYNDFQNQRHEVLPGITGYAQVMGRNSLSWEEKFELDVYYVKNRSFVFDLKILWNTVKKVLMRSDINDQNSATTEPFTGTQEL